MHLSSHPRCAAGGSPGHRLRIAAGVLGAAVPVVAGALCGCGREAAPPVPPVSVHDVVDHLPGALGSTGGGRSLVQ